MTFTGRYATPEQALRERTAPDDVAVAAYTYHERSIVLRLRKDGDRSIVIMDDGGEGVRRERIDTMNDMNRVLPAEAQEGDFGYEQAREAIISAYVPRRHV